MHFTADALYSIMSFSWSFIVLETVDAPYTAGLPPSAVELWSMQLHAIVGL